MIERNYENIEKSLIDDISVPGFINLDYEDCELAPGKLAALVKVHSNCGAVQLTSMLEKELKELGAEDVKSVIYLLRTKRFRGKNDFITIENRIVQTLRLEQSDRTIKMGLILDDSLPEDEISISLYVKA